MINKKIGFWKVSKETLAEVKKLVAENNLSEVMQMFPDEWNICSERLDRIDVSDSEVVFIDRGLSTSGGVQDLTWGLKL